MTSEIISAGQAMQTSARLTVNEANSIQQIEFHNSLAQSLVRGEPDAAYAHIQLALELARAHQNLQGQLDAFANLADYYWTQSQYMRSISYLEQAIEGYTGLKQLNGVARCLNRLGTCYLSLGSYTQADDAFERCLVNAISNDRLRAVCHNNLGVLNKLQELTDEAEFHYQIALSLFELVDEPFTEALACSNIGILYYDTGRPKEAAHWLERGLAIGNALKSARLIVGPTTKLAAIYFDRGEVEKAGEFALRGIALARQSADSNMLAWALVTAGEVETKLHNWELAEQFLGEAMVISQESSNQTTEVSTMEAYAKLYAEQKAFERALEWHQRFSHGRAQLLRTEKTKRVAEMQARYEAERNFREAEFYRMRTEALAKANAELEEKNRVLEELSHEQREILGIVAHDLKNPLAGLTVTLDLLKRHRERMPQQRIERSLLRARDLTSRMTSIITRIHEMRQVDDGRVKPLCKPTDLQPIVDDVVAEHMLTAQAKGIQLTVTQAEQLPVAQADPKLLPQCISNLVSNALKFSSEGEAVHLTVSASAETITISVADTGQGITADDMPHLFRKFARLSANPTGGEHSLGLGLYVSKRLVEGMNGTLVAESAGRGQGATFVITLKR